MRKIKWLNLFIIIILPFILSFYFFNPFEKIPLETTEKKDITYIFLSEEYFNKQGLKESFTDLFSVPFGLEKYYLYLESDGLEVNYPDGRRIEKAYFEICLNNLSFNITDGRIPFGPLELEETYEYYMNVYSQITFKKSYLIRSINESELKKITAVPSFRVYARPLISEIIVKIILFWLSWMSICWLLTRIYSLIIKNE